MASISPSGWNRYNTTGHVSDMTGQPEMVETILDYEASSNKFRLWGVKQYRGGPGPFLWGDVYSEVIGYAESTDGINYTYVGDITGGYYARPFVRKGPDGYYHLLALDMTSAPSGVGGRFDYWTSPTGNAGSFTLVTSGALTYNPSNAYESRGYGNITFDWDDAGRVHVYFEAFASDGIWRTNYATGTDLAHLTKGSSNPVFTNSNGGMVGGPNIKRVGNNWLMLLHHSTIAGANCPTEECYYTAPSITGPWTYQGTLLNLIDWSAQSGVPYQMTSTGNGAQIGDASITEKNGVTYLTWSENADQSGLSTHNWFCMATWNLPLNDLFFPGASTTSTTTTTTTSTTTTTAGPAFLSANPLNGWGSLTYGNLAPWSATTTTTTTTTAPPIGVPRVSLRAANQEITLTWQAVRGASSYNVYHTSDGMDPTLASVRDAVTGTSATFTGLVNGKLYKFAVSAVGANESALSPVVASTPFILDPLRFFTNGRVVSFAETPGGPFRICVGGRVLEFAVGGSGPVRFNTAAGVLALSSPSDYTIPQDLYSGGSLDLAGMVGVLTAGDPAGSGKLDAAALSVANTLPSADLAGSSTLGTAGATGILAAGDLTSSGTVTAGTVQTTLTANSLTSAGTLDQAQIGSAGIVADNLTSASTLDPAGFAGGVGADDLASTGALDVPAWTPVSTIGVTNFS